MKDLERRTMIRPTLVFQSLILAGAIILVVTQVSNFPFPSPAAQLFLGPKERWPAPMVKAWIESGNPDASFVEFFGRDPDRVVPEGDNFVAPADGVVKGIYERDGIDYFTVGLSFWDVHVVRTPMAGVVQQVETEGVSLFKDRSESADFAFLEGKAGPVQTIVTVANDHGTFKIRLITSYWASRIKVFAIPGERLEKGQRIGRILLGSSVVVDFSEGFMFQVRPGERVVAGETIIVDGEGMP
jgi:phosphatidylserine decarboxylase